MRDRKVIEDELVESINTHNKMSFVKGVPLTLEVLLDVRDTLLRMEVQNEEIRNAIVSKITL